MYTNWHQKYVWMFGNYINIEHYYKTLPKQSHPYEILCLSTTIYTCWYISFVVKACCIFVKTCWIFVVLFAKCSWKFVTTWWTVRDFVMKNHTQIEISWNVREMVRRGPNRRWDKNTYVHRVSQTFIGVTSIESQGMAIQLPEHERCASACLFSETCRWHNATLLVKQWKSEFTSISHGSRPSF